MRSATASACCSALVGQVQPRGAPRQHLAGGGGLAVAHEQHERGRRGSGGGRAGHGRASTYRRAPWDPIVAPRCSGSRRRWWRAGPARAWWPGGSRWPTSSGPRSATRSTGAARCPGFGDPDASIVIVGSGPGRPRRQPHRPDVHRRPLGRLPLRRAAPHRLRQPARRASTATTGCALDGAWITAPVRCAPPANKPTPDRARHLPARSWTASSSCSTPAVFVTLGAFGYQGAVRDPRRAPRPKFAPRRRGGGARRPLDPRQLPREPAEHLHRHASPSPCSTPSSSGPATWRGNRCGCDGPRRCVRIRRIASGRPRRTDCLSSSRSVSSLDGVEDGGDAEEGGDDDAEAAVGEADGEGGARGGRRGSTPTISAAATRQSTWPSSAVGDRAGHGEAADAHQRGGDGRLHLHAGQTARRPAP